MSLQCAMASGKVLEETYLKWVQYKDDCVKMIENEPLPQGTVWEASIIYSYSKRDYGRG